ncbi:MAG TPA: tetratricopeptide repeat protein, partial [Candidatus Acidoferrum sp.]|nr:tetratricopeptide repeat protein [Candidatus Acidoferrum sp.]
MALDTTEEEQVEALKRWWNDNGTSMLLGIVIVLALLLGARKWQESQENTAGEASELYDQLAQMSVASVSKPVSEDDLLAASRVYTRLKQEFASSIYTRYG